MDIQGTLPYIIGTIVLTLFAKFLPKEKINQLTNPISTSLGTIIDFTLLRWFPKSTAEKIEEGVFSTLFTCVSHFMLHANEVMLSNNEKRRAKKSDKDTKQGTGDK